MDQQTNRKRPLETPTTNQQSKRSKQSKQRRNAFGNRQWEELFRQAKFNQCLMEVTRDLKNLE